MRITESTELAEMLADLGYAKRVCDTLEWAQSEIEKAQARHGEQGMGPLWNSFTLLQHTHEMLLREPLFRAHCREILERVARNEDTRPGTDAEMIVPLHKISLVTPMNSAAACLYFRLLARSVPELARAASAEIDLPAYEKIHGRAADEYEAELRDRLRNDSRTKRGGARSR